MMELALSRGDGEFLPLSPWFLPFIIDHIGMAWHGKTRRFVIHLAVRVCCWEGICDRLRTSYDPWEWEDPHFHFHLIGTFVLSDCAVFDLVQNSWLITPRVSFRGVKRLTLHSHNSFATIPFLRTPGGRPTIMETVSILSVLLHDGFVIRKSVPSYVKVHHLGVHQSQEMELVLVPWQWRLSRIHYAP